MVIKDYTSPFSGNSGVPYPATKPVVSVVKNGVVQPGKEERFAAAIKQTTGFCANTMPPTIPITELMPEHRRKALKKAAAASA